jgi:hypothetical protein
MKCCRETKKMGVPPGNRPAASRDWFRGVPERYVAGADTRGRQEGRPYPWSQQVIHKITGHDPETASEIDNEEKEKEIRDSFVTEEV